LEPDEKNQRENEVSEREEEQSQPSVQREGQSQVIQKVSSSDHM